jgi:succinate dehydrogenase / fumarate reductase, membrane anchor subunit
MGNGTQLGRVRGLGSAKTGTHHWTLQRVTAIANLTLLVWFVISLLVNNVGTYADLQRWLAQPTAAVPLALLAISVFTHLRMGLQVLIEDYLHGAAGKFIALILLTFYSWGGLIFALFCIAKIALGATPNVGQ